VRAAVYFALYCLPPLSLAQEEQSPLQEILVTATRREQTIEQVPYNLTAISGDELKRDGTTDLASLSREVPALSIVDFGARNAISQVPIIRGLNAGPIGASLVPPAQSPVATYIGNSPIAGYFHLDDVRRIEVLRGPQGTLYGAGALGGAIRIIPNSPEIGVQSGNLSVSAGAVAHAGAPAWQVSGMMNVPISDVLAFRASADYKYDPGFIDAYGLVERTGSAFTSPPTLADPADPVHSSAIYTSRKDWNFQRTFTGRSSLLWKPNEGFNAELAFMVSHVAGDGAPETNSFFEGGPYGADPKVTFPKGGDYTVFKLVDEPYKRTTSLTSLDMTYDAGFATFSSTSSYYRTRGVTPIDTTFNTFAFTPYEVYYTGNPVSPHFIAENDFQDTDETFTQEVRLVSKPEAGKPIDYVAGAFFETQDRTNIWDYLVPGTHAYSVAQGCTAPYSFGASFPNCLVPVGPDGATAYYQRFVQHFKDKSLFGEVTWHMTDRAQLTLGGRRFWQDFAGSQPAQSYPFSYLVGTGTDKTSTAANIWKVNPSYEYAKDQHVYATWSQGFRRGGENAFPIGGPLGESPTLLTYQPDKTTNYEVGFKGRFADGINYSFAMFDIEWDKPQIVANTPHTGWEIVYNANKAASRGFEFESSGPLFLPHFSYVAGFAYADAKLTQNFSLPANDGTGTIVPGLVGGRSGTPLPGSPKTSAAVTLNYDRLLSGGYSLTVSLNATYTGSLLFALPTTLTSTSNATGFPIPSYTLANLSASFGRKPWRLQAYATNLADRRVNYTTPTIDSTGAPIVGKLFDNTVINRPREIGLRLLYEF